MRQAQAFVGGDVHFFIALIRRLKMQQITREPRDVNKRLMQAPANHRHRDSDYSAEYGGRNKIRKQLPGP